MILSVYATDEADVRDAVVDQALQQHERALFTSLHMPETRELAGWVAWMARVHREAGLRFWADVSPASFEALGCGSTTASASRRSPGSPGRAEAPARCPSPSTPR